MGDKIQCQYCLKMGKNELFTCRQSYYKHRKTFHPETVVSTVKHTRQQVVFKLKHAEHECKLVDNSQIVTLQHELDQQISNNETLRSTNHKLCQDNEALHKVIHELNQRIEWLENHYDRIIKNVSTKQKTTVKPTVPKQLKTKIWQNAYGTESVTGKCCCCGIVDLHITFFEAGHLTSHANGGEMSEKNLRPVCSECNKGMGAKNMRDYAMVVHPTTSPLLKEKKLTIDLKLRT